GNARRKEKDESTLTRETETSRLKWPIMLIWKEKTQKKASSKNKTKQNSTLKVNKDFGKKPTHQHRKIVSKSKRNGKKPSSSRKDS
ncbi:Hypothetical predicted protein, partial [Mytilus galloprovincialis]